MPIPNPNSSNVGGERERMSRKAAGKAKRAATMKKKAKTSRKKSA